MSHPESAFAIPALVNKIIAYEGDGMTEDEEIAFFQELINTGLCWQLQGHYGRAATRLIEAGVCQPPGTPLVSN